MIRDFLKNQTGSVAIMAGGVFLLLTLAAGGAVDYSRATTQRHALQDVVDNAALTAASLRGAATEAEREAAAVDVIQASETCAEIICGIPTVSFDQGTMTVFASADVPTYLLQVFGTTVIGVDATAVATAKGGPLKVAMVLDYSSSMDSDNKYQNMRTAAVAFLDKAIARPQGKIAIGVVPFSRYVLTPMNGSYLNDVEGGTNLDGVSVVTCLSNRNYPHSVGVATPNSSAATKWNAMSFAAGNDPSVGGYSDMPSSEPESDACQEYADEGVWVRPLTKSHAATKTAVQGMEPVSGTNIALGVDMGWHMLSDNEPFTEATIDDPDALKVMILLTDGAQTISADGPFGNSVDSANSNITESCEAIKADGVEIFVIAFAVEEEDTRTLLKNCATNEPFYYEPDVTDQLDIIFEGIYYTIAGGEPRLAG